MKVRIGGTEYRNAMGHFATGITVVTARNACGQPYGLTVNSFSSLSMDPPLVQWTIKGSSYCWPSFSICTAFAVNILASGQEAVSHAFCKPVDRFATVEWEEGLDGLPLIRGCLAWIECSMHRIVEGGDHWILMGEVVRARTFERKPLLFWRGRYMPIPSLAL